jgi:hypothetical protein
MQANLWRNTQTFVSSPSISYRSDPNSITATGIAKLTQAFAVFADNQQTPLCHKKTWKGLISTAGFTASVADVGNTYQSLRRLIIIIRLLIRLKQTESAVVPL